VAGGQALQGRWAEWVPQRTPRMGAEMLLLAWWGRDESAVTDGRVLAGTVGECRAGMLKGRRPLVVADEPKRPGVVAVPAPCPSAAMVPAHHVGIFASDIRQGSLMSPP
jgi:hypothetical protein